MHFKAISAPPYSSSSDLTALLRRHYLPLFDKKFLELYSQMKVYSKDFRFAVNGEIIQPSEVQMDLNAESTKAFVPSRAGKRIGYGVFCLSNSDYPLGVDVSGVMICTYGKVIKSDFFSQFPGTLGPRILGVVEMPALVRFLTTAKTDFIRGRGRNKEFESYYDPVRAEFKAWLSELGLQTQEVSKGDEAARLEKELKRLAAEIPELGEFFGFRGPKSVLEENSHGHIRAVTQEGAEVTFPNGEGTGKGQNGALDVGQTAGHALAQREGSKTSAEPISRTARRGPKVAFMSAPERIELSWVEGNNVIINSGHACYIKVASDNLARRTHCMYAIGSGIQRFVAEQTEKSDGMLIDRLMSAWGKK